MHTGMPQKSSNKSNIGGSKWSHAMYVIVIAITILFIVHTEILLWKCLQKYHQSKAIVLSWWH